MVNAKANHQIGHHLGVLLRLPDNGDGLVDVQQDALETLQKMELLFLLFTGKPGASAHSVHPPAGPFLQNLSDSHHPGHAGNENVEITGNGVLEGSGPEQPGHELVRISAALEIDRELEAVQIGFIPHIGDFLGLARFDQFGYLINDGLHSGRVRDLIDLNKVFVLYIAPLGPQLQPAPAGTVNVCQGRTVIEQLPAGGEVGSLQDAQQIHIGVPEVGGGGVAHLA